MRPTADQTQTVAGHPGRYATIDGLRGLAALSVVIYHLHANLAQQLAGWLDGWIAYVMNRGYLGVPVFFVLSGFVITLSVDANKITPSFAGRFALRRSVRLDPPYWASIAVAIAFGIFKNHFFPDAAQSLPSAAKIASHLVYLQDILGYGDISSIYWTLCFEIQFYVFLLLLLSVGQRAGYGTVAMLGRPAIASMILFTAVLSSLVHGGAIAWSVRGIALGSWYCFSLGMFCYWALRGWLASYWFVILWIGVLCVAVATRGDANDVAALTTSALLFIGGKAGRLHLWLSDTATQYLGRISYSLYLFHATVGWSAVSLFKRLIGSAEMGAWLTGLALLTGAVASLAFAHLGYLLIERPSVRLSRRIPLTRKPVQPSALPLTATH